MSLCKSLDLSRRGSEGNHLFRLGRRRVRLVGPILFTTHKIESKGTWPLNSEIKPGLVKTAIKSMKREHDAPRGRSFLASGLIWQQRLGNLEMRICSVLGCSQDIILILLVIMWCISMQPYKSVKKTRNWSYLLFCIASLNIRTQSKLSIVSFPLKMKQILCYRVHLFFTYHSQYQYWFG